MRTAICAPLVAYLVAFFCVCRVLMKFQAASGDFDLAGIAQVQPPERLTLPLPPPSWVGIAVWPSTSVHCGHGFAPVFCQLL